MQRKILCFTSRGKCHKRQTAFWKRFKLVKTSLYKKWFIVLSVFFLFRRDACLMCICRTMYFCLQCNFIPLYPITIFISGLMHALMLLTCLGLALQKQPDLKRSTYFFPFFSLICSPFLFSCTDCQGKILSDHAERCQRHFQKYRIKISWKINKTAKTFYLVCSTS